MNPIVNFFLVIASIIVVLSFIWFWATKRQKASLRLLTIIFAIFNLGLGGFLWYATRDSTIIVLVFGAIISQSTIILMLPKIAPGVYKKFGIKW